MALRVSGVGHEPFDPHEVDGLVGVIQRGGGYPVALDGGLLVVTGRGMGYHLEFQPKHVTGHDGQLTPDEPDSMPTNAVGFLEYPRGVRLCVTDATHKIGFGGLNAGSVLARPLQEKQHKIMVTNRRDLDTGVASRRADSSGQRRTFTETKAGLKTTEFMLAIAAIVAILIAVYVGDADLDATDGWRYASWVAAAYIVSRGLAKLGTREPYAERFDKD
jgi:hypothetical protein